MEKKIKKNNIFRSSELSLEQSVKIKGIEEMFNIFYNNVFPNIPEGREKSLMITKLEEACMWATKAISKEKIEDTELYKYMYDKKIKKIKETLDMKSPSEEIIGNYER